MSIPKLETGRVILSLTPDLAPLGPCLHHCSERPHPAGLAGGVGGAGEKGALTCAPDMSECYFPVSRPLLIGNSLDGTVCNMTELVRLTRWLMEAPNPLHEKPWNAEPYLPKGEEYCPCPDEETH